MRHLDGVLRFGQRFVFNQTIALDEARSTVEIEMQVLDLAVFCKLVMDVLFLRLARSQITLL